MFIKKGIYGCTHMT